MDDGFGFFPGQVERPVTGLVSHGYFDAQRHEKKMYTCRVRLATKEDCDRLEELEIELFPENCMNAKTLEVELEHGMCWVVTREEKIIAYLLARVERSNLLDVLRVGVLPEYRSQGIGTHLIRVAMQRCRVCCLYVRKENHRARRLYERLRFRIVGTHEGEFPSWLMQYENPLD